MKESELKSYGSELDARAFASVLAEEFSMELDRHVAEVEIQHGSELADAIRAARTNYTGYESLTDAKWDAISSWWRELAKLGAIDPEAALEAWQQLRQKARRELDSGHRAAKVVAGQFDFGPMDRARFLELRQALRDEWGPRPGSESFLIDTLAQIQTILEYWIERHMGEVLGKPMAFGSENQSAGDGTYLPLRLSETESQEFSLGMVDRLNRMYLRNLRSLRDLRRMAPQVFVQNAGQVNVAEKQINVDLASGGT